MKQKRMPKQPDHHKKILEIVGVSLLAIFFVCQVTFDVFVYARVIRQHGDNGALITNMIISAVEGLRKPAPVEASTGKVYFPEAKLVLPPVESLTEVKYAYTSDTPELEVTTTALMHQGEARLLTATGQVSGWTGDTRSIFEQVPNLQACTRGVQIFFSPSPDATEGPQFQLKVTKTLADGRTVYMYTESNCKEDLTPLVDYLKQIESY